MRLLRSRPTRVSVSQADGTRWLEGQGTGWDRGGFTTLEGVVRGIDGTTGGWATLPGTRLAPVLLTQAQARAISPYTWGNYGSTAHIDVWGGAAFNGRSFLLGSGGGHFSYFGNELYRVRVTDAPKAVRLYDPAPVSKVEDPAAYPNTFCANEWGPVGCHHYDQWCWDPSRPSEYWMSGANCRSFTTDWDHRLWRFDLDAPTPKQAWRSISLTAAGKAAVSGATLFIGPDGRPRYQQGGHPSDWWDRVIDPEALQLSAASGYPGPGWGYAWFDQPNVLRLDATTYVAPHRYPFTAPYGSRAMQLVKKQGSDTVTPLWAPMPAWFNRSPDFDLQGGLATDGRRIVIWGGRGEAACFDTVTAQAVEYAPSAMAAQPPGGTPGNDNGIWGRWGYVPEVRAFVGLVRADQDVWVFRPPAAWGVGT